MNKNQKNLTYDLEKEEKIALNKDYKETLLVKEDEPQDSNLNKLIIATCICVVFMIVEIIGGYMASSIA